MDIAPKGDLYDRWIEFTLINHLQIQQCYEESLIGRWPRCLREELFLAMSMGIPSYKCPPAYTNDLTEDPIREIAKWEPDEDKGRALRLKCS